MPDSSQQSVARPLREWVAIPIAIGILAHLSATLVFAVFAVAAQLVVGNIVEFEQRRLGPLLFEWNYSVGQLLSALIVAPLIENLILAVLIEATRRLGVGRTPAILGVAVVAYVAHGAGIVGLHGTTAFLFFALYYFAERKHNGWQIAYWKTVIAHASASFVALLAGLVISSG